MARDIRTEIGALGERLGEKLVTQAIHHNQAMHQQKVLIKAGYRVHVQAMLHERFIGGLVDGPANPVAAPVPPASLEFPHQLGPQQGQQDQGRPVRQVTPGPAAVGPVVAPPAPGRPTRGEGQGNSLRATTVAQRRERDAAPHHKGKKILENSF